MKHYAVIPWLALSSALVAGGENEAPDIRAAWEERGITFGGGFSGDMFHESHTDSWLYDIEASAWAEADLGTLIGADDFYAYVNPSLAWGAEEEWDWNLRLYQAWLSWDGNDHFNARAGMLDPGWFFHSLPSAGAFVRLPSRVAGEFSPGGLGLLDLYPISAPAVHAEWKPVSNFYLQAATFLLEPDHEIRGRKMVKSADGFGRTLTLAETGWRDEGTDEDGWKHRFAGIGGWWIPAGGGSWGAYAFTDVKLWTEAQKDWQGLSGFASASIARADGYDSERRYVGGLSYEGLVPGRDEDTTSFALIVEKGNDPPAHGSRHAWELLYQVRLNDHWWLQWALQRQDGGVHDWRNGLRIGCDF